VTDGSTTRMPCSSKMALVILWEALSINTTGCEETNSLSVSEKLSALVNTKYQVNVVRGIKRMVHDSLIVSSSTPVAVLHAQE
jgi:fatty acid-binding protein DegV